MEVNINHVHRLSDAQKPTLRGVKVSTGKDVVCCQTTFFQQRLLLSTAYLEVLFLSLRLIVSIKLW